MKKVYFLFGELNDDDIDWMIASGNIQNVSPGTVLIEQGKPIDNFYILLVGKVSVAVNNPDASKEIAVLTSGEVLGEMSFIDSGLPSASVKTAEESIVLSVTREELANRLDRDVGFASRFYRAISIFLASRLRTTLKYVDYDKNLLPLQDIEVENLGQEFLQNVPFAKARYDWLLRHAAHLINT
jgi:bacteriocin-type transport-associated protein